MTSTNEPSKDDDRRPSFGLPGRLTDPASRIPEETASEEEESDDDTASRPPMMWSPPDPSLPTPASVAAHPPQTPAPPEPRSHASGGVGDSIRATEIHEGEKATPSPGPDTEPPSSWPRSGERVEGTAAVTPSAPPIAPPGPATPAAPGPAVASGDRSHSPFSRGTETPTSEPAEALQQGEVVAAAPARTRRGPDGGPRIIAVANQKGGVGKTTTTVNFGAAAAELGHRVLIVDLDPQGNASTGLGINPRSLEASMYDVLLHDVPIDEAIEAAEVRNLFVAPANLDLAGAEIELVPAFSREMRLKNAIADVADDFDLVLIDCPPSLGLLTVNAFAAANEVLVPIQCEYYALEGLGQLLRNVDLVKRNLNAALELSAIVLVMFDARTNLAAQVADEVREHFGSKVCRAVIPRNIRLSEAPSFGQPITVFDPSSRGAIAYRDLAKEVAGEPS